MVFYSIKPVGIPRIRFACSVTVRIGADSGNIIDHRQDMIELSICDRALDITTEHGERRQIQDQVVLFMPDCRYVIRAVGEPGDVMNMASIAVESEGLQFTRCDLPPEEIPAILSAADRSEFFLPEETECDEEERRLFTAQFQMIMQHYSSGTASEYLLALAGWFEFAAMLDARFRRTVSGAEAPSDSGALYVYKARKFICSHLGEELRLERIAAELGVSASYLCTLFRRVTGQTMTDYIGGMRCRQIREQILHTDDSLAAICVRCGLHDRRYAQRLFKKYFGVSMQRCRQLGSGISLYHENPWKREHMESDIYETADSE